MQRFLSLLILLTTLSTANAIAAASRFYANQELQAQAPAAFALQPQALPSLIAMERDLAPEREAMVTAIRSDAALFTAIKNWEQLTIAEQLPYLRQVFALEVAVLGIVAPELAIDTIPINGPAYFDFDPNQPGPGKVVLNTLKLAEEENKYASLLLLIHETRHSAQFQRAFAANADPSDVIAIGFRAAFRAQKELQIASFCDFLTLLNEHEAFQFGNYVVGQLTDWQVGDATMGTFASQYDQGGQPKINLLEIAASFGPELLLEEFNRREEAQYNLLFPNP